MANTNRLGRLQWRRAIPALLVAALFTVAAVAGDGKAKAEEVRALLVKDPSRFAELAKEHSACPSGEKGGDLGRFERGEMAPEFEAAAFAQKPGEIGAVVESPYGFHIIQVQSHETESAVSLEEARPSIVLHLRDESRRDAMEKYVKALRDGAKITRMAAGS